ncbi:hypothetical protein ACF0H5_021671 [Mactra antiquata]
MDVEYSNFMGDDFLDEENQIKSIAKKTWLSSASTSLANLEKVKTNVYNFGIADPRDLKATNLRTRKPQLSDLPSDGVLTDLHIGQSNLQKGSLKAWGSNSSIPESVRQNGSPSLPKPTRPGSAKFNNNRVRPPSGKKTRPQSAKEPLPTGIVSEQTFGVKGAKYDPSGRPPKGAPSTCSIGWVGPPAGLQYPDRPPDGTPWQMDLPLEDDAPPSPEDIVINERPDSSLAPPPVPHGTPIPPSTEPEEKTKRVFELFIGDPYKVPDVSDDDNFDDTDDEEILFTPPTDSTFNHDLAYSTHNSTHLDLNGTESLTPDKESLRLSLPTADDDYDEMDDVDTERLLAEAESVSKKFNLKSIISSNKNLPVDVKETETQMKVVNKKRAENLVSEIIDENGLQFDKNNRKSVPLSKTENSVEPERTGVKFNENVTTVNITPRNIGRKVEELHPPKKRVAHQVHDNFVDLIEMKNRVEPVLSTGKAEISEKDVKPQQKSASRPPSGKKISANDNQSKLSNNLNSRKQSPYLNNSSKTSSNKGASNEHTSVTQVRQRPSSAPTNRVARPITTVMVDYGISENSNEEKENKAKKRRQKKGKDDVVTMMETINLQDFSSDTESRGQGHMDMKCQEVNSNDPVEPMVDIMSAPTVYKSDPEKNYYEISRHSSMSNTDHRSEKLVPNKMESMNLSRENSAVYKTTKTIEFDKKEAKEVTVKSIIDPQVVINKEKEFHVRKSPELLRKKPPSRPSSAKPTVNKQSPAEDTERPGSRLGFVAMAPDSKSESNNGSSKSIKSRPSSAPTYGRPRSTLNSKNTNDKKSDKKKVLTEKEKDEREKVIDNLLERTRTLIDEPDKQPEQDHSQDEQRQPTTEKKKRVRPFSAHNGLLSRKKEHECKTSSNKRPSSAVVFTHKHYASYSSSKGKNSSGKSKVILTKPCIITTNQHLFDEEETEEDLACQQMEKELAEKGVNISAATLQRALYPPSGKPGYYHITADLPKKPSLSLLSHPKVWLPEEYKKLQKAEKTLARANETMFLQEKAEKRRALLESLTPEQRKRLKRKEKELRQKKSGKLRRSKSAV